MLSYLSLSLSLDKDTNEDIVLWGYTRNGCYTMKSGYWLGMMGPLGLATDINNQLWSKVWNIHDPPKLRHFLWRACKGSLPVNEVMSRRHIRESNICSRCNEAPESICHALIDCVEPRNLWMSSPFGSIINDAPR